jgi:hypothetical protein
MGPQTREDRVWGPWPSDRGQDAHDTQGRDALATKTIANLRMGPLDDAAHHVQEGVNL